ncbi:MAG: hypothetical protein LBI26_03640 [Holosporales bacterium]|jgi:hypothetical protein|nr:hypothetical protein [Holosporales bacterium]
MNKKFLLLFMIISTNTSVYSSFYNARATVSPILNLLDNEEDSQSSDDKSKTPPTLKSSLSMKELRKYFTPDLTHVGFLLGTNTLPEDKNEIFDFFKGVFCGADPQNSLDTVVLFKALGKNQMLSMFSVLPKIENLLKKPNYIIAIGSGSIPALAVYCGLNYSAIASAFSVLPSKPTFTVHGAFTSFLRFVTDFIFDEKPEEEKKDSLEKSYNIFSSEKALEETIVAKFGNIQWPAKDHLQRTKLKILGVSELSSPLEAIKQGIARDMISEDQEQLEEISEGISNSTTRNLLKIILSSKTIETEEETGISSSMEHKRLENGSQHLTVRLTFPHTLKEYEQDEGEGLVEKYIDQERKFETSDKNKEIYEFLKGLSRRVNYLYAPSDL